MLIGHPGLHENDTPYPALQTTSMNAQLQQGSSVWLTKIQGVDNYQPVERLGELAEESLKVLLKVFAERWLNMVGQSAEDTVNSQEFDDKEGWEEVIRR